jgi:hypothetical protein
MTATLLFRSNSSIYGTYATFKKGDLSQLGRRTQMGACSGFVAVWIRNMLTGEVGDSRPNTSTTEILQAKWMNRYFASTKRYPAQMSVPETENAGKQLLSEFHRGLLQDAGLQLETLLQYNWSQSFSQAAVHAATIGRTVGYLVSIGNHALGFVVEKSIPNINYYFFDPNVGAMVASSILDFDNTEVVLRATHAANVQYKPIWDFYRVSVSV